MFNVSKTFSFCYGHRLLGDSGRCRHLHGHTAKVTFTIASENLDQNGMVMHFERLKETIGKWIDENLDHTLILSRCDPIAKILSDMGERYLAIDCNPTAERIAELLFDRAKEFGLNVTEVQVWESESSMASFKVEDVIK